MSVPLTIASSAPFKGRPVIVGIYGIDGSGKTYLLNQLKKELGDEQFAFFDGSMIIDRAVPGGLDSFKRMTEANKVYWRSTAIEKIGQDCAASGRVGIVAGHFIFWEEAGSQEIVWTKSDAKTFTHILLYLDTPVETVIEQRKDDKDRPDRPRVSVNHLRKWQQAEKTRLTQCCRDNSILLAILSKEPLLSRATTLLRDFKLHNESYNLEKAFNKLDALFIEIQKSNTISKLETMLLLDADMTLTAEDTGSLFWEMVENGKLPRAQSNLLKELFSSPLGYSYTAFRQAVLLCEDALDDDHFELFCHRLAAKVAHIGIVIVTCGLQRVWEKVITNNDLYTVRVIGGGRIADDYVITASVKAELVARLQQNHGFYVFAFGDSPLDLPMLRKADESIIVVGEVAKRSKTMDKDLEFAICNGFRARQVLLPSSASPRLDIEKIPLVDLIDEDFRRSIISHRSVGRAEIEMISATDKGATKLLQTPTRNSAVASAALREAHRLVGCHLAIEYLSEAIGMEEYEIAHVQGQITNGYRLANEMNTSIVALMRGGEPMAFGISDAFPVAMFIHARHPRDLELHSLQEQRTIILVDSVVNTGKSVVEFVRRIRNPNPDVHIIVVTAVVHRAAVSKLQDDLNCRESFTLIALRFSDNQFKGTRGTDTGNRLFNTVQKD